MKKKKKRELVEREIVAICVSQMEEERNVRDKKKKFLFGKIVEEIQRRDEKREKR